VIFKDLVEIKNKIKIEKPLPPHPKTAQRGYVNGFVSLRRMNGRFCGPGRKSRFGSKLRKPKRTFSFFFYGAPESIFFYAPAQPMHDLRWAWACA
jgi:hypothetical protein